MGVGVAEAARAVDEVAVGAAGAGVGVAVGFGVAVAVGLGVAVGVAVGFGVAVVDGVGAGVAVPAANAGGAADAGLVPLLRTRAIVVALMRRRVRLARMVCSSGRVRAGVRSGPSCEY